MNWWVGLSEVRRISPLSQVRTRRDVGALDVVMSGKSMLLKEAGI